MTVRASEDNKKGKDRGIKIMKLRKGSALKPEREGMRFFLPVKGKLKYNYLSPCFKNIVILCLNFFYRLTLTQ